MSWYQNKNKKIKKIATVGEKIRTEQFLVLESVVCLLVTGTNCLLGGGEKLEQLQFNLGQMGEQAINRTGILPTQTSIHLGESHNKNGPSIVISGLALSPL